MTLHFYIDIVLENLFHLAVYLEERKKTLFQWPVTYSSAYIFKIHDTVGY